VDLPDGTSVALEATADGQGNALARFTETTQEGEYLLSVSTVGHTGYAYDEAGSVGPDGFTVGDGASETPEPAATAVLEALVTGRYAGKGRDRSFGPSEVFSLGDEVVLRASVVDEAGVPLDGATLTMLLRAPSGATATLSADSNAQGVAEATYKVHKQRGESGAYAVEILDLQRPGTVYDPEGSITTTGFVVR